jgi:PAS domain S-box-containing protein
MAVLGFYSLTLGSVFLASVLLAIALAGRFRSLITDPILSLAETARKVGENNDYSVRSKVARHRDELGVLANAFNHMLSRIESQDAALSLSQQKLEGLVNSLDGIVWEWDSRTLSFTYVSRQSEALLGYAPSVWIGDPLFRAKIIHEEDRQTTLIALEAALEKRQPYSLEYRMSAADCRTVWIRESGVVTSGQTPTIRGIFQDITEHKTAASELQKLNRQLMDASRLAGMAEVATGVLHNVGNVLNSANVSATLLKEELSRSETETLAKVSALLNEQNGNLASFLTDNPKGKLIPQVLTQVSRRLSRERELFAAELDQLSRNIEHIKDIVAMQQSYARVAGVLERLPVVDLVEDALRINAPSLARAGVEVIREFEDTPTIIVDTHKAIQILINLIRNAKLALADVESGPRRLRVAIRSSGDDRIRVMVQDNGVGIPPENLTRIFSHGFTTRKDGHGFGLHIGALNAKEMGGSLSAASDGPGCGATFTLELPVDHSSNGTL